MSAIVHVQIGVFKIDQVSSGATVGNGSNFVLNRNQTKQNFANYTIGDAKIFQPIGKHVNFDLDVTDNLSQDGPNNVFGPTV